MKGKLDNRIKELLEEMRVEKEKMTHNLEQWTPEELQTVSYGKWNALQVLEHVITSEVGTLGYLSKKTMAAASDIPAADEENKSKGQALSNALRSDKKWEAPGVLPEPKGERSLEKQLEFWDQLRDKHEAFLHQLDASYYSRQIFNHPLSGRLDVYDTLEFQRDHIAHHIFQLNRIKEAID